MCALRDSGCAGEPLTPAAAAAYRELYPGSTAGLQQQQRDEGVSSSSAFPFPPISSAVPTESAPAVASLRPSSGEDVRLPAIAQASVVSGGPKPILSTSHSVPALHLPSSSPLSLKQLVKQVSAVELLKSNMAAKRVPVKRVAVASAFDM